VKPKKVNIELIQEQLEQGTILSFSFFIKAKLLLGNSTIYHANTSLRSIGEKFGCSHTVVKKYLTELEKQELVRWHSGNLTFVSLKKEHRLTKKNQISIYLSKSLSIREIAYRLQFAVLKKNAEQQEFMMNLKTDLQSNRAYVDVKQKRKHIDSKLGAMSKQQQKKFLMPTDKFVMSNLNLAKKLSTSTQSISYIKNKWQKMGLCKFYRQFKKIGEKENANSSWFNKACNLEGVFMSDKGVIYQSKPSKFILLGKEWLHSSLAETASV